MIQALEAEDWRSAVRTVKVEEARAVLAELEGRDAPIHPAEAAQAARTLLGYYPSRDLNDPNAFAAGCTSLMAVYPKDFVKRVINPVTGLPSRLKFVPSLAEVREALDAEKARRARIIACAKLVLMEAEKARQEAEEARRFEAQRPTAEERARRVQELLRPIVRPPAEDPNNGEAA